LEQAVRVMARTQLLRDLDDADVRVLTAFLRSLTGVRPRVEPPQLP
jgi:cytochrome c peroxidase